MTRKNTASRARGAQREWTVGTVIGQIVLSLAALAVIVPTLWIVLASFKSKSEFYGNPWALPKAFNLENYVHAFTDAHMGEYFGTTVFVTVLSMIIVLVVALPCAYVLARFEFPGRKVLEILVQGLLFVNVNYIVVPIFLMLVDADDALRSLFPSGLLLSNPMVLSVVYAATALPFTIYLLEGFFASIPKAYEEAALLDGASQFTTMVRIFFPMALPAISMSMLFNFLTFWNDYIISMTLMTGEQKTLQVGLLNLMAVQRASTDYGRLYAGMVIVMVPVLIFYLIVQKRLLETSTMGGVK